MKALQKLKHWLRGPEPQTVQPEPVPEVPALWRYFEAESRRFKSMGVEGYSLEEMWRLYIRACIHCMSGTEAVVESIKDIVQPKEQAAAEWRRLEYLKTRLRKHAQRFPVSHSGH